MDSCAICRVSLPVTYYRISGEMACESCANTKLAETTGHEAMYSIRGILFALGGAIVAFVLRWGFESFFIANDFLQALATFLRWFLFVAMAGCIVTGARAGAAGRGGVILRIFSTIFFYLAVTLSFVPILVSANPQLPRTMDAYKAVAILCLALPFLTIFKSVFNAIGVFAILICMAAVWNGAGKEASVVDGPFDARPGSVERQMFKPLS